jgi:hypothetical protein
MTGSSNARHLPYSIAQSALICIGYSAGALVLHCPMVGCWFCGLASAWLRRNRLGLYHAAWQVPPPAFSGLDGPLLVVYCIYVLCVSSLRPVLERQLIRGWLRSCRSVGGFWTLAARAHWRLGDALFEAKYYMSAAYLPSLLACRICLAVVLAAHQVCNSAVGVAGRGTAFASASILAPL